MRRRDFDAAYLQGVLEEDEIIYCSCPPGHKELDDTGVPYIFRVEKPVYGMAQAGRRWQRSLFPFFLEQGFLQFGSDPCLFRKCIARLHSTIIDTVILGVYVDDLCFVYSHDDVNSIYTEFTKKLVQRWEVEDEGPVTDLLNIQFDTTISGQIKLHHQLSLHSDPTRDSRQHSRQLAHIGRSSHTFERRPSQPRQPRSRIQSRDAPHA